jgi:hypothetical protein
MHEREECVRSGTWLYDDTVSCRVDIWRRSFRPGTGDPYEEAAWREDQPGEWYEIQYYSPIEPGRVTTGGGYYPDLTAAVDAVRVATHGTVRWTNE